MNKNTFKKVSERSKGFCEECGRYMGEALQKHHAFGASNRTKMELPETVFDLCMTCHLRIHKDIELNLKYKRKATQNLLSTGWNKGDIMIKVGRWYGE